MASDDNDVLTQLTAEMAAAAQAKDFERAAALRNEIAMRRQAAGEAAEEADFAGLKRQQPGAMGIGSERPKRDAPVGWKPPKKPDPMTTGRSQRGRSHS